MPNIKSAKKRVLVTQKKTMRNRAIKTGLKTQLKKYDAALKANDASAAKLYQDVSGALDKAALKGVIHKNKANRKKARLAKALNKAN